MMAWRKTVVVWYLHCHYTGDTMLLHQMISDICHANGKIFFYSHDYVITPNFNTPSQTFASTSNTEMYIE